MPRIHVDQAGDTLKIRLEDGRTCHMVRTTLDVEITMPELTKLILKDRSDATVTDFGDGFETEVAVLSKLHRE